MDTGSSAVGLGRREGGVLGRRGSIRGERRGHLKYFKKGDCTDPAGKRDTRTWSFGRGPAHHSRQSRAPEVRQARPLDEDMSLHVTDVAVARNLPLCVLLRSCFLPRCFSPVHGHQGASIQFPAPAVHQAFLSY